ncbi:MAG: carboxypeptidase M32 [Anaerolineales bacterium]|nr:carboxypeptidase M32 [Anaerolineales bacterium]
MQEKYPRFQKLMEDIHDLGKAAGVLSWDRSAYMPPGGAAARARQSATIARVIHEIETSDEMGELLETMDEWKHTLDPDSDEFGLIRLAQREYTRARAIPADLVSRMSEANGLAAMAWQKARAEDDFAAFLPHLEKVFALAREYAAHFPHVAHPYDALLDRVEQGLTKTEVERIFNEVKGPQSDLLHRIMDSGVELDDSLLHQSFPREAQLASSLEASQMLGYDLKRGRLDTVTHPFATSFSVNDVRITTRVYEDYLAPCLFGTLHETGHALYELGVPQRLEGLPTARGASAGVHESQSRLFENLIGRSAAFAHALLPVLQKYFPAQLGNVTPDVFFRAVNKVQPSFIRVEADEVSYNLHIIIRFEIEVALLEGRLAVKDLPEAWRAKFEEYLGVTPPNNREGVLQDVHWSWGLIGHFQSYALGNIIASQWWSMMAKDLPQDELMRAGNITPIREWLGEHVHQYGRKYTPKDLIQKVTGGPINTAPFLAYLEGKFGEVYGV